MKEINQVTCLVFDHGLFLPLALEMGRHYKRVLYHKPGTEAFPTLAKCCIGDGFEEIECCDDPWPLIDKGEIDLAIFPDILDSGLQIHLQQNGIAVWGSRRGDSIELVREKFLRLLKDSGLAVPEFDRIVGVTALRDHLKDRENLFIKISRFRGDCETFHWESWDTDEVALDVLAVRFGPCKELVPFLVFTPIETDIEDGADTWSIDGQWPSLMCRGIECKDKALLSSVTPTADLPDHLQAILEEFGPILSQYHYRNFFSMEVRVTDEAAYFIDPTCRGPVPGTGTHLMLWKNLPEVVWAGANGWMVEPEPAAKFAAECVLTMTPDDKFAWTVTEIPKSLETFMKINGCCSVGDKIALPPDEMRGEVIGWLGATGDTPGEVIEALKYHASQLPDSVTAHTESLVDLVIEAEKMAKEQIPITDEPLPEPAEVVEP